jgi:hypothetical protein
VFGGSYAQIRQLDQGIEKKQLSIYLRRETLGRYRLANRFLSRKGLW